MQSDRALKPSEIKKIDPAKLCDKLAKSAEQAVSFLEKKLQEDGSYGSEAKDLACYFKSPMMFLSANKPNSAIKILQHIKTTLMTPDGDFKTTDTQKSANGAYAEYWSYTNGWIIRAANLLGYKEITEPASNYFAKYNLGQNSGFSTNQIGQEPQVTDVLTVAHHGLINLEMGDLATATSAAYFLCEAIKKQADLAIGFYLRLNRDGSLITQFSKDQTPFYFVSTTEVNQLHFMIGYPAAYLAIMYKKTNRSEFLTAAKAYLDFSLSCNKQVYECDFSHKLAWAASLIYECTGDEKYLTVIDKISDHFIAKQKNGMWFSGDINSSYDQSAEIACWFLDIVKNINDLKKKASIDEAKNSDPKTHSTWTSRALKYSVMAVVAGAGLYSLFKLRAKTTASCDAVVRLTKGLS